MSASRAGARLNIQEDTFVLHPISTTAEVDISRLIFKIEFDISQRVYSTAIHTILIYILYIEILHNASVLSDVVHHKYENCNWVAGRISKFVEFRLLR